MRKQNRWRSADVAAEYDERRFGAQLRSRKHLRDQRLLVGLLGRALGCSGESAPGYARSGDAAMVLDLPCGTGRLMEALAEGGGRVIGADISLEMMSVGASRGAGAMVQASAFALPFKDGAFEATVSMRFLFHLDDGPERVQVLRELGRVTAGVLVGQVRYRHTWKHVGRWARSRVGLSKRYRPSHSRADIARELSLAGLELVEFCPVSRLFSDKALFAARAAT